MYLPSPVYRQGCGRSGGDTRTSPVQKAQRVQMAVEVPQVHFTNKVADAPVIMQRQVSAVGGSREQPRVLWTQQLQRSVNVPVGTKREIPTMQFDQNIVEVEAVDALEEDKMMQMIVKTDSRTILLDVPPRGARWVNISTART